VLIVLIGWQFAAAEYVGGIIMIVLLAALGGVLLAGGPVRAARARLDAQADHAQADQEASQAAPTWRQLIRTRAGWSNAASYTVADLSMLRRELIIGFVGAGVLAAEVPTAFWHAFFISGHGIWTSVENAIVGPFIAMISFVCSIGNVPLAAALWSGGISFGGVISFIFADLIALPLVLVYRKYYGGRLALRMLAVFWTVMAAAGLVTELVFSAAGLVPAHRPPARIVPEQLSLNYTTVLNLVFIAIFCGLYYLHRNRDRLGADADHATDPVCGMRVAKSAAPARLTTSAGTHWFCSDHCRDRFAAEPLPASPAPASPATASPAPASPAPASPATASPAPANH
jgi:uncharacterized protein